MRRLVGLVVVVLGLSALGGPPPAVADPSPGECEALTSAELGDPSTRIVGTTPADADQFDCYLLPDDAGTVYRFELYGYDADIDLTVHDGAGANLCGSHPAECRLTGDGPFTLRIDYPVDVARHYRLQVLRVSGATGCPQHGLTVFGSDADVFHVDGTEPALQCWKVDVPQGPLLALGRAEWTIHDPSGNRVCDFRLEADASPYLCRTSYTGPAVMTLRPGFGATDLVPVFATRSTAGCDGTLHTAWTQAPTELPARDGLHHCRWIDAPAGARVLPRSGVSPQWGTLVLDAAGSPICDGPQVHEVGERLGCVLEGPAPYRLVASAPTPFRPTDPQTYPVAVRTLTPGADCPTIQPTPWGAAPADHHPGNGCRTFHATAGQSFVFGSVAEVDGEAGELGAWVIDADGRIACIASPEGGSSPAYPDRPCNGLPAGKYVAVTDALGSDHVTMLYDRRSSAGCRSQPPTMALVVTPAAPGQVDCYRLANAPAGVVGWFDPGNPAHLVLEEDQTPGQVFRADGTDLAGESCPYARFCLDDEDGPHRLIVGDGVRSENVFVTYTLADLTGCQKVRRGTSTQVRVPGATRVRCVLLDRLAAWREDIRLTSDERFQTRQAIYRGVTGCQRLLSGFQELDTLRCGPGDGLSSSLAIVVGSGPQTVRFVRDAPSVRNRVRPRIRGVPRVGATLRVRPGRWTPAGTRLGYQWLVDGREVKGATRPKVRVRRGMAGHRVTVVVTGSRPRHYSTVAKARRVVVRR